jgi:hypothetical protein
MNDKGAREGFAATQPEEWILDRIPKGFLTR